jgi:hypothetical protein
MQALASPPTALGHPVHVVENARSCRSRGEMTAGFQPRRIEVKAEQANNREKLEDASA